MVEPVTKGWDRPDVILVATDLSETDRLLPFAMEQAAATGARLILLHVLAATEAVAVDAVGMPYYDPAGAVEFAAKSLETWCGMARGRGLECNAVIREGTPAQQILACARQFKADRILMGTRSRGKISKLLLGSVAEQVLRSTNLPVITVGPEAHLRVESHSPERVVLHATTLREASRPSAALACRTAALLGAKLVLLNVLPPLEEMKRKGLPGGLEGAALHELEMMAAETAAECSAPVESRVLHGNPAIEILAEAAEKNACLIVLGATQRSVFENLTRDRTVYRVLAHARCPVLTLREPRIEKQESVVARLATHS
jgi:nucleotide-binding universal stress UspA family protein